MATLRAENRPSEGDGWSGTGPVLVADGVVRVPLPLPGDALRAVNVYVLRDGDRVTLIDAGWGVDECFVALEQALAGLDLGFDQVDRMLITHLHRDHYTLAVQVRRLFGTRIEVGIGERASIERLSEGKEGGHRSWLTHWGADELRGELADVPSAPNAPYELPDVWIDGPTEITVGDRVLHVIPTPGHTRGHLVFADFAAGLLFSGDHVLPRITPSIGYETVRADLPLNDYLGSLRLVRELPDLTVLPAHGRVGVRSHQRVDELLEHHAQRLRDTEDRVGSTDVTAMQVAANLPWTRRARTMAELDTMGRMLAIAETAAHLDLLVRRGALASHDVDGTRLYSRLQGADQCARQ